MKTTYTKQDVRHDLKMTAKALGYIAVLPAYIIIGCIYKPLKYAVSKLANFDK